MMNYRGMITIYFFEMARMKRTLGQSLASPVISSSLYFIVFGTGIGDKITISEGVSYGAFIVPGLLTLALLTQSISNASFGIFFPKFTGTIYEILSAPVSSFEIIAGYVGAATSKSLIIGGMILIVAHMFFTLSILRPIWLLIFMILTSLTFSLLGFIIGIWADNFEKLQILPTLVITPLTFLGGSFYSIDLLPPFWQKVSMFNPAVYLISGFRWSFYGKSYMDIKICLTMIIFFLFLCFLIIHKIFKTGYRLKS